MSEIVEVLFKGEVRELFANPGPVILRPGDHVVVPVDKGEDIGKVILKGEWVSKKAGAPPLRKIVRKATAEDMERRAANAEKEIEAFKVCRERIEERELKMKLVDVECRFDGNRITFYFTAEKRVDFRELVKDLASVYRTRIELRQIGVRDEAKRIGGFGSCGRKFCCTTFLREFEPVTLKMAKEQHLSLSPSKISGACGRLMCCLMYEVDAYRSAIHRYPKVGSKIKVGDREAVVNRVDIFREGVFVNGPEGGEDFISAADVQGSLLTRDRSGGNGGGRPKSRRGREPSADPGAGAAAARAGGSSGETELDGVARSGEGAGPGAGAGGGGEPGVGVETDADTKAEEGIRTEFDTGARDGSEELHGGEPGRGTGIGGAGTQTEADTKAAAESRTDSGAESAAGVHSIAGGDGLTAPRDARAGRGRKNRGRRRRQRGRGRQGNSQNGGRKNRQ